MNDNELQSFVMCQTSIAHTYGNVTAQVQNYILNLFPPNTFKTMHVHSKIAYKQLTQTPDTFLKKVAPMFILRPRVEWNSTDKFLQRTLLTERTTDLYYSYALGNLLPFIADPNEGYCVKWQLNRDVMMFDIVLVFDTIVQQMNWVKYLQNSIRIGHPFFIQTCLESYIPRDMMAIISQCAGIPIYDENKSVSKFLEYLNGNSQFPITYKFQGGSGNDEFFRYYNANIDTTISDLNVDDGERIGQINKRYQISFTMRCEFNSTGFYYIFSSKLDGVSKIIPQDDGTLIPIFTDVLVNDDIVLNDGWKLIAVPSARLDSADDVIDIRPVLNKSVLAAIDYHIAHGMPMAPLFNLRVRKQGRLLEENKDYTVELTPDKKMNIKFVNGSTSCTYKFIVSANIRYINELIKEVYNLK